MRSIDMIGVREDSQVATGGAYSGMLKGHVKLVTEYVFPTLEHPEGQQLVWAGRRCSTGRSRCRSRSAGRAAPASSSSSTTRSRAGSGRSASSSR
jgi:hypothetical protein